MSELLIRDIAEFEEQLSFVPSDVRNVVAHAIGIRAVLRVVPLLTDDYQTLPWLKIHPLLLAFRNLVVARVPSVSLEVHPPISLASMRTDFFHFSAGLAYASSASAVRGQSSESADLAARAVYVSVDSFAADSTNAALIWDEVTSDLQRAKEVDDPNLLFHMPIWTSLPDWWNQKFLAFRDFLSSGSMLVDGWSVWLEWYEPLVKGKLPFDLKYREVADRLERSIAMGGPSSTFNDDFWRREPGLINREIALWVADARAAENAVPELPKPVFISYTEVDKTHAKRIGEVIESDGYRVFAQFKDMPPGSNFVTQMQSGLASMGKFVPVYSPRYLASDHCQAEWNAAYNMDPLGKRKLIVGFLLEKTELLPLQKQTVYVPLYGLTETQAKSAILTSLSAAGAERTPSQTRQAAKDYAVPVPETNATGQLTFVPSAEVEQPFIDNDIARLPTSMLRVLGHLLAALEGPNNAPQLVTSLLRGLQSELTVNGAMAHVPDLQRDIEILLAERGRALRDGAVWAGGGFGVGIEQLEKMFSSYRQNFPLVMVREIERRQAAIDPAKFDDAKFKISHDSIAAATEAMGGAGQTDASVAHVVSQRQRQRKDIEILGRYVPQGSDRLIVSAEERTVEELKKDFMFDESGLWDRTLGRVEKVASIADSTGGKALIVAAKEFLKSIWGG